LTTQDPTEPRPDGRSAERSQAQATWEEDARLQAALLDNIPGCIALIVKKNTREIVASNRFAREIGAVPGQTCFKTCASRDDQCPFCLAPKVWATGEGQQIEVEYRGTWYEGIWAPLSEDLYVHYIFDITERKQAEELLRLTQFSVDRAADAVFWTDPGGHLILLNDAACRLFGYSREELLAMTVLDLDPSASAELRSTNWERMKEEGTFTFETVIRTKSGDVIPVEVTVNYLQFGGREYNCVFARDITERKEAEGALLASEEQLRQSQKMEAIGQLAGGIAHDFNNLLAAILGYSDMILTGEASSVDEVRPDVMEIKHAAERAAALTKQILAFSRRQALRPTVVSLNDVLDGMEPLLRRTLGEDIELLSREDPELSLVEVDVHQFEQVIINLALNARDAMSPGGRLTLETANRELDEKFCRTHPGATPGPYVMLSVSDTGVGMDADTIEHVFEPFFTTKAPGEGTGLGLATVYGIIKQSNGSIFAESEAGKGTNFTIYLPQVTAHAAEEIPAATARAQVGGTETILLVEDEVSLRNLVERVLGDLGYRVLVAGTATEALNVAGETDGPLDLLLTDVVLPGDKQGNDLARDLLSLGPDLTVLYMSGYPRNAIVHAGRLDEGVNFLEKPFTPEALARMVRAVLDQPRGLE